MGTYSDEGQKRRGFIWRKGVFTAFINVTNDHPDVRDSGPWDQRHRSGCRETDEDIRHRPPHPQPRHGFLRSSKGVFTTLDFPGADYTIAEGINNAGTGCRSLRRLIDDLAVTASFEQRRLHDG